jgi:hypothetical protein
LYRSALPGVAFPLSVSASRRYLIDRSGRPFLIHGDSPWDLIVTPTLAEATSYMENRRRKGVNTLLVELIEHKVWPNVAAHAPNTIEGTAPFLKPGDVSTPNDAYFDYAHSVLAAAKERGMLVLMTPAYMGYVGLDEGWWNEMNRDATPCSRYGDYLAAHFHDLDNVIWVHGGDRIPTAGSTGEACALAIMRSLLAIPGSLHTGHWNKGAADDGSLDEAAFAPFMQIDSAYTYGLSYQRCLEEYSRTPAMPTFLIETQYEGEHDTRDFEFRRQAYWADLTCGAGQVVGNLPLWPFAKGWRSQLESNGASDMVHLVELFGPRRWYDLVPDRRHALVTAGYGSWGHTDYVTAGATEDGRFAVLYVPSTGTKPRSLAVDLGRFSGPVSARWYNPIDGRFTSVAGLPLANVGTREFSTPGDNGAGENDWAMVLEVERDR